MPVVFQEKGFRFRFFSFESDPREPVRIHVTRDGGTAKLWLFPELRVSYNRRLTARTAGRGTIAVRRREETRDDGTHTSPEPTAVTFDEDVAVATLLSHRLETTSAAQAA